MSGGHSVLAVPVPELDAIVRAGTARHDASFVSADPAFSHAHVTVLAPWLERPTPDDLRRVGEIVSVETATVVELDRVEAFPDGTLHLRPEPAGVFERLTAALAAAFPQTPPYGGRYGEPVPHLTLDHLATGATVASLARDLAHLLPVRTRVERVDLQWWANHDCRRLHSWPLARARAVL